MAPKARTTKQMIIDAAFEITRTQGINQVNARTVSEKLNCSTQPVMYHFKKINDLKQEIYKKADEYHSKYLMNISDETPMTDIALNYIRFGAEEKNLFHLLFQSDRFSGKNITELFIPNNCILSILEIICKTACLDIIQAGQVFKTVSLFSHGYACMLANNKMSYNESTIIQDLQITFSSSIYAAKYDITNKSDVI